MTQIFISKKPHPVISTDEIPSGTSESSDELVRAYQRLKSDIRPTILYQLDIFEDLLTTLHKIYNLVN